MSVLEHERGRLHALVDRWVDNQAGVPDGYEDPRVSCAMLVVAIDLDSEHGTAQVVRYGCESKSPCVQLGLVEMARQSVLS